MTKTDKRLELTGKNQQRLVGVLNHQSDEELVILCHGYTSSKDFSGFVLLAECLNQAGVSTYRFDFSGSGESPGDRKISIIRQVEDLRTVVQSFGSYKRIYLLAHSLGTLPVVICNQDPRVSGIITVNGFFLGPVFKPEFKRNYAAIKILRWVVPRVRQEWKYLITNTRPSTITKPILIITTPNDEVIDYRQSIEYGEKLAGDVVVKTLPLTGHGISNQTDSQSIAEVINTWINSQLKYRARPGSG